MSRVEIFIVTLFVLTLGCASLLAAQSGDVPSLPDGPMKAKVTTACTECHEARIILQQRLSKAAWMKEVDKMTKWGAAVDASDREGFIDYLSINFPADKAPYQAPRMKK
jgi:hypothetical protein